MCRTSQPLTLAFELEPLERRDLLAGNVTAVVTAAGDLRISGDAQDNNILVNTAIPGTVTVLGESGTTVNGSALPVHLSLAQFGGALTDDVFINLRGGNDSVIVGDVLGATQIGDQLVINTGSGNDTVGVYDVVAGDLRITTAAGDDAIAVVGSSIVDTVFVSTAAGQDAVYFDCSFASNRARLITGSGDDGIFFASSAVKLQIITGAGNDGVAVGDTLLGVGDGRIVLGGGNDLVAASDVALFNSNPVIGGGGADAVVIGPSSGFQNTGLVVETTTISNDANGFAIAAVIAFQTEWSVRGMSPLIFVC